MRYIPQNSLKKKTTFLVYVSGKSLKLQLVIASALKLYENFLSTMVSSIETLCGCFIIRNKTIFVFKLAEFRKSS